jgi:hypothetical protein
MTFLSQRGGQYEEELIKGGKHSTLGFCFLTFVLPVIHLGKQTSQHE